MKFAPTYLALISTLVLVACAKPTAMTPHVSKAEIAREQANQEELVHAKVNIDYNHLTFSKSELKKMEKRLQRVTDKLAPEATKLCRELKGPAANCNMYIQLSPSGKGVNAHADGEKIVVYPALVGFAMSDTHLALVLAHEYTHHIMKHVSSAQKNVLAGALLGSLADALARSQGMSTGGKLGQLGAQASMLAYSPSFEHEADYIGLYMLARAGYKIEDAPGFWRKMAQNNPKGIYNRTTHPTTPERYVSLEKTIKEIRKKQAAGARLLPNIKQESE